MAVSYLKQDLRTLAVALDDISATEWRDVVRTRLHSEGRLHSMISVLPNGGGLKLAKPAPAQEVALDDISATEWRRPSQSPVGACWQVALDDISATEWRHRRRIPRLKRILRLHSMISVLPNGGTSISTR